MFVKVVERRGTIYYFPVTEISYIIDDIKGCTIFMKNGNLYQIEGEIFLPSIN